MAQPPVIRLSALAACLGMLSCGAATDDPSLVQRRDGAGVEIVEALRPMWGDSSPARWSLDPDPVVDLAQSGTGPYHQFDQVVGMARRSDGSLLVADAGWTEIRLYASDGGFLGSAGREGEGPGEFSGGIEEMHRVAGDTLWVLDWDGRISVFALDLA